jgi:anti-sigma factor RsiW
MNKDLSCQQVSALLNFYIEDKLNPRLKEYVNLHIENCPKCKKKIEELRKILSKYKKRESHLKVIGGNTLNNLTEESKHKLSAYIDNELNQEENIKIKKMTISNPNVRKELETMYNFRNAIHSAYEKTKTENKYDYSKIIISQLQDTSDYSTNYFYKLATIFVVLITAIIAGFIYLYF